MILRNVAIRHGRRVLATPLQRSCLRQLTTEIVTDPPTVIDSSIQEQIRQAQSLEDNLNPPQLYNHYGNTGPPPVDTSVAVNHHLRNRLKKRTASIGSIVAPHYVPGSLVSNPPRPKDVTLELLMAAQSHMGHSTSLWNPGNQRYIYGIRQGIHIISLEITAAHLRRAAKVVEGVAYHGGLILFVGTRKGQASCVVKAAEMAKACHLFERWTAGTITNGDQILARCGIKAVDKDDRDVEGYEQKLRDWKALRPDLVVVMNPLENYVLLHECGMHNIPTIGVIDTDADPTWVTYPIPANDDSLRCIQVIAGVLGRAGQAGQKKRLEAAKTGEVTWQPEPRLGAPERRRNEQDDETLSAATRTPNLSLDPEEAEEANRKRRRRRAGDDDDDGDM